MVSPPPVTRAAFRADIQGLRAVAVLLVVIYHAGVLELPGGYVGVDVFFVISGFLITNHLISQLQSNGHIEFRQFYARRARRILPASFAVLLLTMVASFMFLPPAQLSGVLTDSIWTALYVPNMAFAVRGTDYLAETAPSPFQHYWSLGVEEQFYLFWPLALLLVWLLTRRSPQRLVLVVWTFVVMSFAAAVALTYQSQPWAFFSLPTRAWELAAGAIIALVGSAAVKKIRPLLRSIGAWLGLAAILFAAITFDELTPFPGTAAVIPVAGAAAVVFFGQQPTPFGPGTLLSIRPMVFIGAISYSLYLVHWPLLVIPAAAGGSTEPLPAVASLALGLLGIPLAWVLYELVENPVRRSRWLSALKVRWTFIATAGASAATVAIALALIASVGTLPLDAGEPVKQAVSPTVEPEFTSFVPSNMKPSLASASEDIPAVYNDGCHLSVPETQVQACAYGDPDSETVVVLFGDSHAAQWFPALEELAVDGGFRLESYTKSSCPSVDVDIYVKGILYVECEAWRDSVIEHLSRSSPDLIVLSNMANQPGQPDGGISLETWGEGVRSAITRMPRVPIALISDTPQLAGTPGICLSVNLESADTCAEPRSQGLDSDWERSEAQAAGGVGATVINLNDYICDSDTCGMIIGSTLVYRDVHHLTREFVVQLAPQLGQRLRPLLAQ